MTGNGNGDAATLLALQLDTVAEQQAADATRWRELAQALRAKDVPLAQRRENLIRAARAMRTAGALDDSEVHYFIASTIIAIAEDRLMLTDRDNPALRSLSERIESLKDNPATESEREQLSSEFDRIFDEIIAATFDEFGEPEMGNLYRYNQSRFDELLEEGRQKMPKRRKQ